MRIHITLTKTENLIPFNYQPMLTGALHKWIGQNALHDDVSLYSFSWITGADISNRGLQFKKEGNFFISSYKSELLEKVISGIQSDPSIGHGLFAKEVIIQKEPEFKNEATFFCASPVFIKRRVDDTIKHYTYKDDESGILLTETLVTKLEKAGLPANGVSVEFDKKYHSPKTKVIYYNEIGNRVSICPVIVKGTPEQIAFAWNVGVGNSTGIGFGALK